METILFTIGRSGPFEGTLQKGGDAALTLTFRNVQARLNNFRQLPIVKVETEAGRCAFQVGHYVLTRSRSGKGISGRLELSAITLS